VLGLYERRSPIVFMYDSTQQKNPNQEMSLLGTCVPQEVKRTQLIRIVVNYGEKHPERLQINAGGFVLEAMRDAFPCSGN
jgi:hypothetical protein